MLDLVGPIVFVLIIALMMVGGYFATRHARPEVRSQAQGRRTSTQASGYGYADCANMPARIVEIGR